MYTQPLDNVTSYIKAMTPAARRGLLGNFGDAIGGSRGTIAVAHLPSIHDEEIRQLYAFHYMRDAGLVYDMWVKHFTAGLDPTLRRVLDDCVLASVEIQHMSNPSGNLLTGGLAETKVYMNMTPVLQNIPRPADDGPPIRAIFMLEYADWLIGQGNETWVNEVLWPSIHLDLMWIATNWNRTSYEFIELLNTRSFWTSSLQYHALRDGSRLASKIGYNFDIPLFEESALYLLRYMQIFWNDAEGYIRSVTDPGRTLDVASLLAINHNFDAKAGCDAMTFQPCSDRALSHLKVTVERFKPLYPITLNYPANKGSAIGLFVEDDVFYGGQPWYKATFACAEMLYYALTSWDTLGELNITAVSLPFFRLFDENAEVGRYDRGSRVYTSLHRSISGYADSFIELIARYTPPSLALTDWFNKSDGSPIGGPGFSGSYSAALTAFAARDGFVPRPWGAAFEIEDAELSMLEQN